MKKFVLLPFFLVFSTLFSTEQDVAGFLNRISAHLVISDYASASQETEHALKFFPSEKTVLAAQIKTFAHSGNEKGMWDAWNHYVNEFPEESQSNQDLQEVMAWGIIWKASYSPLPMIRLCSLLGAFFGNDAKSIVLLKRFCKDKSIPIRNAAVQLSSEMRDAQLCDEILLLLKSENIRKVRLEVIKAAGKMKIRAAQPTLLAIVGNDQTSAEEKAAAIASLFLLFETIERPEILALSKSDRAGLRLLACQVVGHLRSSRDEDLMKILASDNNSEVRTAAMYSLGLLRAEATQLARKRLNDPYPEAAVTAAWLLTLNEPESARETFMPLVRNPKRSIRLLASAAIAATGKKGISLAQELFHSSHDPFFKMNLALGLIHQQTETYAACLALQEGLSANLGRWMWKEENSFRVLSPSDVKQDDSISNAPEAIDQLVRLEILNILAVMKYPGAEVALRGFLQQHKWGVTGLASALLLMEGDDSSMDLVLGLLEDQDPKIQMQAALTVALWGGREEAISLLQTNYSTADRETKEKILEGLGKVGSRSSIPFLLDKLQEQQQILRLIAASSLLQCLYH
ncbi:MAG: HEAT repeat domain-containing protein [Parachlamydiaceae bacterium]|nr:HEAT repeat domain-containing protein [Parachlamydiaceae bacterium]